ncbi:unnamed protein product, partial [marine sediment metagenome]
ALYKIRKVVSILNGLPNKDINPVLKGVSYFLAHVPSMVRHGSKPSREIRSNPALLGKILEHLETFEQAVAYAPNQVFIGNMEPDDLLHRVPSPWYKNPLAEGSRWSPDGEIMPEEEFYGMMKISDDFGLVLLDNDFLPEVVAKLKEHPLITPEDLKKLEKGATKEEIEKALGEEASPLYVQGTRLIGCVLRGHEADYNLTSEILMENPDEPRFRSYGTTASC